jgi:hypothetical protein
VISNYPIFFPPLKNLTGIYVKVVVFASRVYYYTIVDFMQWIKETINVTYTAKAKAYVSLEVK